MTGVLPFLAFILVCFAGCLWYIIREELHVS